jgi:hypothetical protein
VAFKNVSFGTLAAHKSMKKSSDFEVNATWFDC